MKYVWQEEDIKCGQLVCLERGDNPASYIASCLFKIGFVASLDKPRNLCLIALSDGMVLQPMTKAEVVIYLNQDKYRPAPILWVLDAMKFLNCEN